MLQIMITANHLIFKDLTDEMYEQLTTRYGFEFVVLKGEYHVTAKPEKLYKILLQLSYDYDVELF